MINKLLRVLKNPQKILIFLASKGIIKYDDKKYLEFVYKEKTGKNLDLNNVKTFNEKLQWLKLYDRKPEYTNMADKYEVRNIIKELIGEEYLIPFLGVYNSTSEIDFEKLPNQFVLKPTHDSGTIVICKDKSNFDQKAAIKKLNKALKRKYFYLWREWPYKNIKPRIIAEKYMKDDETDSLNDYKFYCFNGEPKIMLTVIDRGNNTKGNFYDMNFNKLDVVQAFPIFDKKMEKPKEFDKMIELSKILSKDIPHLRVDFYIINGKVYFGELTFFDSAGFDLFEPEKYDELLGSWIKLK